MLVVFLLSSFFLLSFFLLSFFFSLRSDLRVKASGCAAAHFFSLFLSFSLSFFLFLLFLFSFFYIYFVSPFSFFSLFFFISFPPPLKKKKWLETTANSIKRLENPAELIQDHWIIVGLGGGADRWRWWRSHRGRPGASGERPASVRRLTQDSRHFSIEPIRSIGRNEGQREREGDESRGQRGDETSGRGWRFLERFFPGGFLPHCDSWWSCSV